MGSIERFGWHVNRQRGNEATAPEAKTESIKAYYTDPDLMELVEGSAEISYKEDQEKYEAAYQALQKSDKADMVPLWEKSS